MSIQNVAEQMELNYVGMGIRKISQLIKYDEFTDDGDGIGDVIMNTQIPAGSFIIGCKATVKTGFTGEGTTATMKVGTSKDNGQISGNSTLNVFTAARNLVKAAYVSSIGLIAVSSAQTVYIGVTVSTDFSDVSAGLMLVEVYYLSTNVELTSDHPTEVSLNNAS